MNTKKVEWLNKNGFNDNGDIYCITGDNTYSIKDKLKELGCRFNPVLKWYSSTPIELPEGYKLIQFHFDDLYEWDEKMNTAYMYEIAKAKVDKAFDEAAGPSLSEFVGSVGERIRNLTATFSSTRGFNGAYGYTFIYTFYCGEDCLVWFTTKELNLEKGQPVDLTGTVKKHEVFRNVKTTQLSRCIIKEIK